MPTASGDPLLRIESSVMQAAQRSMRKRQSAMFEPVYLDENGQPILAGYTSPPLPIDISNVVADASAMRHGAIARAVEAAKANAQSKIGSQAELLNDRWRPLKAAECLGNEQQAHYLRDWLKELQVSDRPAGAPALNGSVRGSSATPSNASSPGRKRKVQRTVLKRAKMRRRASSADSDLDDWIASDSETILGEDEELPPLSSQGDAELFAAFRPPERNADGEPLPGPGPVKAEQADANAAGPSSAPVPVVAEALPMRSTLHDSEHLTNCIILHGPSGCGKTAMVYACAAESGFEIFELFPGMGKRSGHAIELAVGDLARNHMVSAGGSGGGATYKSKSILDLMNKGKKKTPDKALGAASKSAGSAAPTPASASRQSLILIEESDILFEEDKGFWQAIVVLISKSQRPVIITCNGERRHLLVGGESLHLSDAFLRTSLRLVASPARPASGTGGAAGRAARCLRSGAIPPQSGRGRGQASGRPRA